MEVANKIRQQDIELLANNQIIEELNGKTIMVTGATGLIGSEIVLGLLCANRLKNIDIEIIAVVRNLEKAKKVFEKVINNKSLKILKQDINDPIKYDDKVDYIIHTASVTSSSAYVNSPVETIMTTINGTKNILELAKEKKVDGIVYISSIEAYGILNSAEKISENQYGSLDILNPRSSYSEAKRMAENLCVGYVKEYGVKAKIARLTQTFGAGFSVNDNRVFAQFVKSALNKEDIVLHTDGSSTKNYCYIIDAITGILTLLVKGSDGFAYNVANANTTNSIKDVAEFVASRNNILVKYEIDDVNRGYCPIINISLDTTKLENLGWKPQYDLDYMFKQSILYLKEELNK